MIVLIFFQFVFIDKDIVFVIVYIKEQYNFLLWNVIIEDGILGWIFGGVFEEIDVVIGKFFLVVYGYEVLNNGVGEVLFFWKFLDYIDFSECYNDFGLIGVVEFFVWDYFVSCWIVYVYC